MNAITVQAWRVHCPRGGLVRLCGADQGKAEMLARELTEDTMAAHEAAGRSDLAESAIDSVFTVRVIDH
jgi:hypothetical protein